MGTFKDLWREMPVFLRIWWIFGMLVSCTVVSLLIILLIKLIMRF